MSLNKKVLAAAIVGALMVGGTAVAAPLDVVRQYYAQEIVIPNTGLVPSAAPAVTWASGYNYSVNEIKYVRVQLTGATFADTFTGAVTVTDGAAIPASTGTVGAINGLGTNVLTFSVTSTGPIADTDVFSLPLANNINIPAAGNVSIQVSVYDQASQAQAGGTNGLLAIGSYDNTVFLSFARSYEFASTANTLTADVAAAGAGVVPYGHFIADGATTPATTTVAGTLNDDLFIELVDPDGAGPQDETFKADGSPITMADLFAATSTFALEGDFSAASSVVWGGGAPNETQTAGRYTTNRLTWNGIPDPTATEDVIYNVPGDRAIAAGDFRATFTPVAASAAYTVTPRTVNVAGSIRRNGLEIQAPLAQVPPAWLSRLVLTNTGSGSPAYRITVLGENGNTITSANTTGVVNPGTNVIDLKSVMTGFSDATRQRGTIVVTVEAPDADRAGTIQGLYQIVNPESGSISNHVMVRPGTN